jgi:hypothetical protein
MNLGRSRAKAIQTQPRTVSNAIFLALPLAAMMLAILLPNARASDVSATARAAAAPSGASLQVKVLDKAPADECFVSIGSSNNLYPANPPCATGIPKVNGAYIWGMTNSANNLWYGTVANTLCTAISGILTTAALPLVPFQTSSFVCEFDQSNFLVNNPSVPPALGDWRPPKIFTYDKVTGTVTDRTPNDPLINQTLGFRSAGSINDLVILAGPALAQFGTLPAGVNLFAFRNSTGKYLGSTTLTQFSDIRSWITLSVPSQVDPNVLYTGVQNKPAPVASSASATPAVAGGSILRWAGTLKNPFKFSVVGNLDNEPAYLAASANQLFATTWGGINSPKHLLSGLWVSPKIGPAGLTPANTNSWKEVWRVDDYEADPVTAQTLLGGAIGFYNGQVYWGTMQVPLTGALAHYTAYPPMGTPSATDVATTIIDSTRPVAVFRCCTTGTSILNAPGTELLYGDSLMGVYNQTNGWQTIRNAMGVEPELGPAGFGNPFNTYAWSAARFNNHLYFGTFDWSFIASDLLTNLVPAVGGVNPSDVSQIVTQVIQVLNPLAINYGADLWSFGSSGPATAESLYGVGNYLNYGIRTMVPTKTTLYLGTANPMNLRTDPANPPLGGYELLGLHP